MQLDDQAISAMIELSNINAEAIEMKAYRFNRERSSYERLKNADYPNVEALEVRYREMMG